MDRRAIEYLAKRMEEGQSIEGRRRRREDGTYTRGTTYEEPHDRPERIESHKHVDDESRRMIGFTPGTSRGRSHWSEEEFVSAMEESLYHEVDDIFHYVDVMTKVYNKGYDELASAFYQIANEKFVCAEFLRHQLKKAGHYNASEHKELEEDLEEAKKMFKKS